MSRATGWKPLSWAIKTNCGFYVLSVSYLNSFSLGWKTTKKEMIAFFVEQCFTVAAHLTLLAGLWSHVSVHNFILLLTCWDGSFSDDGEIRCYWFQMSDFASIFEPWHLRNSQFDLFVNNFNRFLSCLVISGLPLCLYCRLWQNATTIQTVAWLAGLGMLLKAYLMQSLSSLCHRISSWCVFLCCEIGQQVFPYSGNYFPFTELLHYFNLLNW